jgi:16S rRNA processing protein RimM
MTPSRQSRLDENPGPPSNNEPGFLVVGRILKPHGLTGEIAMRIYTDFPERLQPGTEVFLGETHTPMRVQTTRWQNQKLLICFEGIIGRDQAETLKSQWAMVREDDRPALPDGEFYHHQLIGLDVVDGGGQSYGQVAEILSTGANDVLVVLQEGRPELLIPTTEEVVVEIDISRRKIVINLIPGILPE